MNYFSDLCERDPKEPVEKRFRVVFKCSRNNVQSGAALTVRQLVTRVAVNLRWTLCRPLCY